VTTAPLSFPTGSHVDGAWLEEGDARPDINPSRLTDVVGQFFSGTLDTVDAAVDAARAAQPAWARASPEFRSDVLARASAELESRAGELGALLAREEGKTRAEAVGEVNRAARILRYFSGEAVRLTGERVASTRPGVLVDVVREPVGVVGLVTPWNFPIAIPAWKIAPALAYGNTVVLKPADLVPASACALMDILQRAGLPPGVLNLVLGPGRTVGDHLVRHPGIDAVSFTGSQAVGRRIAAQATERLARVQLEMGSKNPLVVAADAPLDQAVQIAVEGAFYSTGQRCTASSRLIVDASIHDRFVEAMTTRMGELVVGDALDERTDIGPVVDRRQLDSNLAHLDDVRRRAGVSIIGGELVDDARIGHFMRPALVLGTDNDDPINRTEVFGPIATVLRADDYDHALALANDSEYGLCSGICTRSLSLAEHFKANSAAGMVMVNLPTAGVDYHVPFGGRRGSSYGPREQGSYAREFFTAVKTSYVRP